MSNDKDTGAIVALCPADSDPVNSASSQRAHITLAWLGDSTEVDLDLDALRQQVMALAESMSPVTMAVKERGTLGDEDADVLFLDPGDFDINEVWTGAIQAAREQVKQYPEWTPHLTLGYPDEPALAEYDGEEITFDKVCLWVGEEKEDFAMTEDTVDEEVDETEAEDDGEEFSDEEIAQMLDEEEAPLVPIHGVLAPLGVETGDGRKFTEDMVWRDLPIPMKYQKQDMPGHDASVVVASIDDVWIDNGLIMFSGMMVDSPEAAEVISLRAAGALRGVSVDLDMTTVEMQDKDGNALDPEAALTADEEPLMVVSGRVAAATIVSIPAFQEAYFDLGTWEEAIAAAGDCESCDQEFAALAASVEAGDFCVNECGREAASMLSVADSVEAAFCVECAEAYEAGDLTITTIFGDEDIVQDAVTAGGGMITAFAPGTKDGPGWITHPKATSRIRRYWVRGKGAAKIRWGQPGDFNRCRKQLAKYVQNPDWLAGLCANMHKEALGIWPGEHKAAIQASGDPAPMYFEALVASAEPLNANWFRDPELDGPTPFTITEDGRVFGHLATFDTCHIGQGQCVKAPHSKTGYAYFKTGAVATTEGDMAVGQITMNAGHADLGLDAAAAKSHYDHTAAVVADVAAGEDKHGIWVAGALRAGVTDEQKHALKAASLSGDWRRIGGGMEMVAALAVNVPGFPIPRLGLAASAAEGDLALVAAGTIERGEEVTTGDALRQVAIAAVEEYKAREAAEATARATAAALRAQFRNDVIADLRSALEGE